MAGCLLAGNWDGGHLWLTWLGISLVRVFGFTICCVMGCDGCTCTANLQGLEGWKGLWAMLNGLSTIKSCERSELSLPLFKRPEVP